MQHFIKQELDSIDFDQLVQSIFSYIRPLKHQKFVFVGVGKTAYVASRLNVSYLSMNVDSRYLHASDGLHGDIGCITADDVCVIFSYSGETTEILKIARHLKTRNCHILAVTNRLGSSLDRVSDLTLHIDCSNGLPGIRKVPSVSLYAMEILFDLFLAQYCKKLNIGILEFSENHPEGGIGGWFSEQICTKMRGLNEISIPFDTNLETISSKMDALKTNIAAIIENGEFVGCLSSGDVRRLLNSNKTSLLIDDLNTAPHQIEETSTIKETLELIKRHDINMIFITSADQKICGYVKVSDLIT